MNTAKFSTKMKKINIEMVLCYAPTNGAEEKKADFYNRPESVLNNKGRKI